MSKVNVDEIKVGDLISHKNYLEDDKTDLGIVTEIRKRSVYAIWSCFNRDKSPCSVLIEDIIGHWKVINFEEEAKMDELKVYTGKETIEALLEGKTLKHSRTGYLYKFDDNGLKGKLGDKEWDSSFILADLLFKEEFTEVVTPQVGDWVRFNFGDDTYAGEVKKIDNEGYWGEWNQPSSDIMTPIYPYEYITWEILSPEQVSEYKREQAFIKVGRKLNEFKHGDIVYIDSLGVTSVVITKQNENEIKLHGINEKGKGYTAKPHQLTPIAFTEQQVDLS